VSAVAKQPTYVVHCGQCAHRLYGAAGRAWCGNSHCPQCGEQFLISDSRLKVSPPPEKEVA